ncbi:hypothetical protein N7452_004227 [Penicillium brevicompactum]|uniref:Uncharacterized protein n=1 Tax=Penicillium brevicompactum TaxID=5074 RepID=A0A9W9ULI1_PENBR|nr:hypothetical protein N7452_004227 [Penicillium brevicompactum]
MAHVLSTATGLKDYKITLLTSNKAVVLTLKNPRQQSGQDFRWVSASEENKLLGLAKEQARAATQEDASSKNAPRG